MFRPQEIGDPVEGVVVDENCAKQRLFCLDVMRREPECGLGAGAARKECSSGKIVDCWHGARAKVAKSAFWLTLC
jgi:hypothetical protein